MVAHPYWINSQLAIVPRPRGGDWLDDEMLALRDAGIDVVISMLEKEEATELLLDREATAAQNAGLHFMQYEIPDRGVPGSAARFATFLAAVEQYLSNGKHVGVHCRACIGRASVTAASLLIRSGISTTDAWLQVVAARGCAVPDTPEQRLWVDQNARVKP